MRIERTTDERTIRNVLGNPTVVHEIWDEERELPVHVHDSIYWLSVNDEHHSDGAIEDVQVGIIEFVPMNAITWNPHIAILPQYRGLGTQAMKKAIAWMFLNTPCKKIFAAPPAFNTRMIRVFRKCGFKREGISPKSFPWRGEIHDRVLMGLEKE